MRTLAVVIVTILVIYANPGLSQDFGYSEWKNLLEIGGNIKIIKISQDTARSVDNSVEDDLETFVKSNEISLDMPGFGSTVTFDARKLDDDEFDIKLRLSSGSEVQARKKSKIKKILAPILIILLLKAITLIPLALGLLGIKTWNALQLSFVSFVTSVVLAVWKLCAKFSDHHQPHPHIIHEAVHDVHVPHVYHDHHDHHVPHHDLHHDHHDYEEHIVHHDPWDHHHHHRSDNAQQMAYNSYVPDTRV